MKILGISGSPRKNGNTAQAIQYALSLFDSEKFETEYITLAELTLNPCRGCLNCQKGTCIQDDDMTTVTESMRKCDVLILGSPVYMGLISGQMKIMMDRTVLLRVGGDFIGQKFEMSRKIGAGITCGGFRNGGQELALQCIHTYLLQQNMAVIADGLPLGHSGGTIVGDYRKDEIGKQTIENLVSNIILFVRHLQSKDSSYET
jgi:multimeric flavodoxin WrbA